MSTERVARGRIPGRVALGAAWLAVTALRLAVGRHLPDLGLLYLAVIAWAATRSAVSAGLAGGLATFTCLVIVAGEGRGSVAALAPHLLRATGIYVATLVAVRLAERRRREASRLDELRAQVTALGDVREALLG